MNTKKQSPYITDLHTSTPSVLSAVHIVYIFRAICNENGCTLLVWSQKQVLLQSSQSLTVEWMACTIYCVRQRPSMDAVRDQGTPVNAFVRFVWLSTVSRYFVYLLKIACTVCSVHCVSLPLVLRPLYRSFYFPTSFFTCQVFFYPVQPVPMRTWYIMP